MRALTAIAFCTLLSAATVDRLVVAVGSTVITELQIDEDLRVAALLNGQPIARNDDSRRAAADRLVEQLLIQHEIRLSRYPPPAQAEVDALYLSVERNMGGPERMKELLAQYQVSEPKLRAHLLAQLSTLQFIEFRFRPDINISESEIEIAYQREIASLRNADPKAKAPPLDANRRARLSEVLVEDQTDAALNTWLAESRKQVNIRYIDSSLQ
jgi:hypothetical protein